LKEKIMREYIKVINWGRGYVVEGVFNIWGRYYHGRRSSVMLVLCPLGMNIVIAVCNAILVVCNAVYCGSVKRAVVFQTNGSSTSNTVLQ